VNDLIDEKAVNTLFPTMETDFPDWANKAEFGLQNTKMQFGYNSGR
jgi:hypothetical protein